MMCDEIGEKLSGLIDGALTPEEAARVESHAAHCAGCRKALAEFKRLDAVLREHAPRETAPPHLRGKVYERLGLERIESLLGSRRTWRRPAAAALAAALALSGALWWRAGDGGEDMAQAAIANHVSSLSGKLPSEIQGAGRADAESWFAGKLPFRVELPRLTRLGLRLTGGRLCHLKGHDVAYLVYRKEGRTLSLFVTDCSKMKFPAKDGEKTMMASSRGYRAACWRKGEIGYILVSDLPPEELERLAEKARVQG